MNNKGTARVEIFGNEYFVKADEQIEVDHVNELAKYVDKKMREIATTTSVVSTAKVAILAALNVADELFAVRRDQQNLSVKDREVEERLARLIQTLEETQKI